GNRGIVSKHSISLKSCLPPIPRTVCAIPALSMASRESPEAGFLTLRNRLRQADNALVQGVVSVWTTFGLTACASNIDLLTARFALFLALAALFRFDGE